MAQKERKKEKENAHTYTILVGLLLVQCCNKTAREMGIIKLSKISEAVSWFVPGGLYFLSSLQTRRRIQLLSTLLIIDGWANYCKQ